MPRICLDTSALLTLRDDEPGAERVAQVLGGAIRCTAIFITRMEVLDHVWKDAGERQGRLAVEQLQPLPIDWLEATEPFLLQASEFQAIAGLDQEWLIPVGCGRPSRSSMLL